MSHESFRKPFEERGLPSPPRVPVDDLFTPGTGPTLFERVRAALPVLRSHFAGGTVTFLKASPTQCGTAEQPWSRVSLDWNIGVQDPRGFGIGMSTLHPTNLDRLMTKQAEHTAARPLRPPPRDVLTQPHLFRIEDGPGPDLLDSDAAYLLAQTAGGTAAHASHGTRLEAAVLATNVPDLPPLPNYPAPTNLAVPTPLWAFRYGDEVDPDRLILIVDARSGGVVWSNSSEPVH